MNITFNNVSFKYDTPLLSNINFTIKDYCKIGLIGNNGSGKTSIINLILETENISSGEIIRTSNIKISYLSQTSTVGIFKNIDEILGTLKEEKKYEFKALLGKFKVLDYDKEINLFSKGEQKRIEIAYVFTKEFDLLILDEITNHLDFDLIIWIESYLKKLTKALILITHDRYFLQNVCSQIYEIERKTLFVYEGNYEKYLELKEYNSNIFQKEQEKLRKTYKKELEWIRQGVEARRTKSKERIAKFSILKDKIVSQQTKDLKLEFKSSRLGNDIIEIENLSKSFGDKVLFKDFSYVVLKNDRVGIVGSNGTGKSTLFKILLNQEAQSFGTYKIGETVKFGYFSQEFKIENENLRVIDYITKDTQIITYNNREITAGSFLENFGFSYSKQNQLISSLSGGEKRRLQLVKVLITNPNVLLLDEPTNDLDIETLEVLEEYLDNFNGVLLIVSHDRYFLDKVVDKIFYFNQENKIDIYFKSISEILLIQKEILTSHKKVINEKVNKTKMSYLEKKEYEVILEEIEDLENKAKKMEELMIENASSYSTLLELSNEKEELENLLNQKVDRYCYLEELFEKVKRGE